MSYTVSQILTIAKISQYLAKMDTLKGNLFGKRIAPNTAQILFMERKAVQWLYDLDSADDTLTLTSNYLFSLCRGYNLKAASIMNAGSGGSISTVTPSTAPTPYQFIVAASGNLLNNGESSVTISSFIGFNLLFSRNGIPQSTITTEASYYSWNRTTGVFTISPACVTGELLQIFAI